MSENDKKQKNLDLNLGLSEFLIEPAIVDEHAEVKPEILKDSVEQHTDTADKAVDPFESLALSGSYKELQEHCEFLMANGDDSSLTKLWWVHSQFEQQILPSSILAAPLESASSELLNSSTISELLLKKTATLLKQVANELISNNDLVLGELLSNRAETLFQAINKVASAPKNEALDRTSSTLEHNSPQNIGDSQAANKIAFVREAVLSKRADFERSDKSSFNKSTDNSWLNRDSLIRLALLLVFISIIVAFVWFFSHFFLGIKLSKLDFLSNLSFSELSESGELERETVLPTAAVTLLAPKSERIRNLSELDALYYEFGSKQQSTTDSRDSNNNQDSNNNIVNQETSSKLEEIKQIVQPIKEKIDLTGPLEGTEDDFDRAGNRPARLSNTNDRGERDIEDARRSDLFGERQTSSKTRKESFSEKTGTAKNIYLVVNRTRVMTRPDLLSPLADVLESGAEVEVIAERDEWLKLRSRRGESGYILRKDVVKR